MRPTTVILIFLVFLNGSATAFGMSGAAADMGIQPNAGGDENIEAANETAGNLQSSGGFGQTLFGLFVSVARWFDALISAVFAAPSMFANLGLPKWLVTFLFGPLYIVAATDVAYILTGRLI